MTIESIVNIYILPLGWKLMSVIATWVIGGWLISFVVDRFGKAQFSRRTDATLIRYLEAVFKVGLRILLVVAIFGILGIETTSFAALLAAAGVAIGMAWAGLLANFAAGVFLVFLRPFKVGDVINVAGVTGQVREIGLFVTTMDTGDNVRVFVGNNAIFSDKIQNYSINEFRRVELTAQLPHGADWKDAIERLHAKILTIPNVMKIPAPEIEIMSFTQYGPMLVVHLCCSNDKYWQVYFDTNRAIVEMGAEAGHGIPEQRMAVRNLENK